ncbi:uncharacterized protein LOC143626379 [Bidens hawaiensis]|uniref:uncharacterized protein LOC143626379 n=1 Tax=Bidens hawaiensis TaxID=980011 RepID=UPI00404B4D55
MPQRTNNQPTPPVILRRSPRLQQIVLADPVDPKTPTPEPHRRRTRRSKPEKCSKKKPDESCSTDKFPGKLERRITRSSCKDLDDTNNGCLSNERIHEEGANISKQSKCKSPKNKVKRSNKNCDNNSDQFDTLTIIETPVLGEELSKKDRVRNKNRAAVTTAVVVQEGPVNVRDDVNKRERKVGVKRKRNQFENNIGIGQSWTKDQELALERAYFEAKPTPHFWKKVSRLVPGKSAQECFDKIHGSHLTPPQPRTRTRPRIPNSQNPSLSTSKLLKTSSPTNKQPRYCKQKSHIIQRTVRHMLQNQYKPDQNSEPDMFSLLEPTFNPSSNLNIVLATPDRSQETEDAHKRSLTHKSVSRFSGSHGTTLVSPPVLKQVKNKALHEKYIDLLNCREANRKAASVKSEKANNKSKAVKQGSAERKEAVKAAKNALVFGAKDAIDEFQNQQATALCDLFDCESGGDDDEDDDQVL